jgi:hypothetical protein
MLDVKFNSSKLFKVVLADTMDEKDWKELKITNAPYVFMKDLALKLFGENAELRGDNTLIGCYWADKITGSAIVTVPNI